MSARSSDSILEPKLHIAVSAVFLDEQSLPEDNIYLWAYYIKIINGYDEPVVIKKRVFEVIDVVGQHQLIEGIGIANNEPTVLSKETFEYASGVLLNQPSGFFFGYYEVLHKNGSFTREVVPSFSLDSKYDHLINQ